MRILIGWALAALALASSPGSGASAEGFGVPLSVEESWKRLPADGPDRGGPLPLWARITARDLPRTTAAMIELDWLHRTQNEVGPFLRGAMRWVAADASGCLYTRNAAEADLRREGIPEDRIGALKEGPHAWPDEHRAALEFARDMTVDAAEVSDLQVEALRDAYGDETLVAMVLLLAHANFQDRLLLGLGVTSEEGGPLPPIQIRLDPDAESPTPPERARPEDRTGPPVPDRVDDPEWGAIPFETLVQGLDAQRENEGRIPVPSFEQYLAVQPADAPRRNDPLRIKWSLVCGGYQPELAAAWSACTSNFRVEAAQDRVFEESLFWVVTRTIHCFY